MPFCSHSSISSVRKLAAVVMQSNAAAFDFSASYYGRSIFVLFILCDVELASTRNCHTDHLVLNKRVCFSLSKS